MTPSSTGSTDPIHYLDATTLAALIRARQLSPRQVVQAHLDRISAVNPSLNAIVTLQAQAALHAADIAADALDSGGAIGPLHGVPFTVKDAIDTAGVPTQRGSTLFAGHIPGADATAVRRLRDAGGILLAKTNLPEFSAWTETDNRLTGRTNNPWNLAHTPGGSSGGESAAIAAGLSPLGIGSDVAISLRGPAACTGIAALKPTHGRIPATGHIPPAPASLWHLGPMARTVRDVALAYAILNGADGIDGYAIHAEPAGIRANDQPLRVGWVTDAAFGPVDSEVSAAVATAAARLQDLGCDVQAVDLPFLRHHDCLAIFRTLWQGALIPHLQSFGRGREAEMHTVGARLMATPLPTLTDYVAAQVQVEALKSTFAGYFQQHDVLLCPVIPFTAPPHACTQYVVNGVTVPAYHVMRATVPFNLTGLPALSVPFGLSTQQLPINVQLVSRWLDEATILHLGSLLERAGSLGDRHPDL